MFVADPGLMTASGHHAAALATLGAAFGGSRCEFYGHLRPAADLQASAERLGVPFTRFFRHSFYDGYEKEWTAAEAHAYVSGLAADYRRLLAQLGAAHARGWMLHHSMDWPHLQALAAALSLEGGSADLEQVVFLMFPPGTDRAGNVLRPRRYLGYRMALTLLGRQQRVRLFAGSSEIAATYREVFELPREPAVHPCFFFEPERETPPQRPASGPVLLYAGDAKPEKGFGDVPEMARMFLRRAPQSRLLVHYTLEAAVRAAPVRRAARQLEAMAQAEPRLTVLARFLPQDELSALLRSASCAVFNYNAATYAAKTSGLLWQACSAGAPVALIGESWLSREARRINPRVRVFPRLAALERELRRHGAVRFSPASIDEDYRHRLFRPLDEFFRAELGLAA